MATKRSRDAVNLTGPAHLCYIALDDSEANHAFQGHVVDVTSNSCYGFMGTQIDRKNPLDCCCQADDPPLWFKITIIDYKNNKETQRIVEKTGGDYVALSSPQILFHTNSLKTGSLAEQHMKKYNPKLLQYGDALVCVGDMTLRELDFEETCEDDNLICSHHHEEIHHEKKPKGTNEINHNKDTKTLNDTGLHKEVADDDFGFEEYSDVKLIKLGVKETNEAQDPSTQNKEKNSTVADDDDCN